LSKHLATTPAIDSVAIKEPTDLELTFGGMKRIEGQMREKPGVCRVCGCSACFFRPTLNSSLLWGRDQIVLGCWQHEDETMSDPDCQELIDRKEVLGPNFGFAFDQDTREWEETGRCSDRSARRNEFVPEAGAQPRANMPSSGYEGHPTSHPQAHQLTSSPAPVPVPVSGMRPAGGKARRLI